jgi:hypothetical protein
MEMGRGAREETKLCNVQIAQEKKNEKLRKKIKHFLVAQEKRGIKVVPAFFCTKQANKGLFKL